MLPVFYSFRRCPYAIRARLALVSSGVEVALREVVLRDKPEAFLAASPSATVPCLIAGNTVIDESLDIMIWALRQHDPEDWLNMPQEGWDLIEECDGPFKAALDRTKYAARYPDADHVAEKTRAVAFLRKLDAHLNGALFGVPTLADAAIFPFVRQFAFIDKAWFDAQDWPHLKTWLDAFLGAPAYQSSMSKIPQWRIGDAITRFPFERSGVPVDARAAGP